MTHEVGDFIGPLNLTCTAATDGSDQVEQSLTLDLTGERNASVYYNIGDRLHDSLTMSAISESNCGILYPF